MIGCKRNQADSLCLDIKLVLDKTLMVVTNLDSGFPVSVVVHNLDLIALDKTLREAECGIIVAFREEKGS